MRQALIAIAMLATTALPSFADDKPGCGPFGAGPNGMRAMMQQHPEMKQQMMSDPQHLLMRAYHENVAVFARALANVARQGETVPRDVARTAIAEMRRSTEEMEKYRAAMVHNMPPGTEQMQKMMDEHLVTAKTHLRQLEELTTKERIPSQEVLKHLQYLTGGCGALENRHMMPCAERRHMVRGGCGCTRMMPGCGERMHMQGRPNMQEMVQKMQQEDAEMARQVERMKHAPRDHKIDLLSDLVARLVQQRAELTVHMEKMQQGRRGHPCGGQLRSAGVPPCDQTPPPSPGMTGACTDEEGNDMGMEEMSMDED